MKKFFKGVGAFLVEIWYRLGLPSPTIFLVIQWISAAVVFVSGLPQLLLQYQAELHVTFPAWMFTFSNKAAFIAGIIGFFISKLTVKNPNAVTVKKNGEIKSMLPFTQPRKLSEELKIFFLCAMIFCAVSCKTTYVPSHDANALALVELGSSQTNDFYDSLAVHTDKSYATNSDAYTQINHTINDIKTVDSARKGSQILLIIVNDLQKRFATYEQEHKDAGSINNSEIRAYKYGMHALWESLHNSEINFK